MEDLTITRPIKPLARAAPATSNTTTPTGAPPGAPPSAAENVRTLRAPWGPSDQSQISRYVRS